MYGEVSEGYSFREAVILQTPACPVDPNLQIPLSMSFKPTVT